MITIFCVRPKRWNVGNDTIFLGVRHLLREAFTEPLNIVQVSAEQGEAGNPLAGLTAKSIHQMNLYGQGVIVGGGNLYENSGVLVDVNALNALRLPLMLFSLSHGRIYDHCHRLVPRTDAMPPGLTLALNQRAAVSVARDEATAEYLRNLGVSSAVTGGCPTLLLTEIQRPIVSPVAPSGTLLSVRHPQLMSIPLADEAKIHGVVLRLIEGLERDGFGPVRLLCHDTRDLSFASSLGGLEYLLSDDVYAHLELLRTARLVVTFRLHAFLPCVSFSTPAINISYDERSMSLVRTIGFEDWDVNFIRSTDVVADVRDRCARLPDFHEIKRRAQPRLDGLSAIMRGTMSRFAELVTSYANEAVD